VVQETVKWRRRLQQYHLPNSTEYHRASITYVHSKAPPCMTKHEPITLSIIMQGAQLVTYRASDGTHPIRYLIKREYKAGGMVACDLIKTWHTFPNFWRYLRNENVRVRHWTIKESSDLHHRPGMRSEFW